MYIKIREKRLDSYKKKIIVQQDNAPSHIALKTIAKISEFNYKLLQHSPYSPDLTPSDFSEIILNNKMYLKP